MADPFSTVPRIVAAPPPGAAAPQGPVPQSPVRVQRPVPYPVQRAFRRNFLDRQDPFETAGRQIRHFTFCGSYELCGEPGGQVAEEIQTEMVQRLVHGNLADAAVELIDYSDAGFGDEPARRFVVTHTDTRRRTLVTVNAYVRAYGQHLYYSVRSYILPPLSIWKLLLGVLFTYIAFTRVDDVMATAGFYSRKQAFVVAVAVVAFAFRKLIRNLLAGDPVVTALRKQFPRRFDWGTFNDDDVAAFLKTSLRLTLGTIAAVLEEHGIGAAGLRAIVQNLQTINVQTGGGSIVGAVFGGAGNVATAKVGA